MNNILVKFFSVIVIAFISISSFSSVSKEQVSQNKENKKVDAKCHVELYGGKETLYFRRIKKDQLAKLASTLKNKEVLTPVSSKKQKIYEELDIKGINPLLLKLVTDKISELKN